MGERRRRLWRKEGGGRRRGLGAQAAFPGPDWW